MRSVVRESDKHVEAVARYLRVDARLVSHLSRMFDACSVGDLLCHCALPGL